MMYFMENVEHFVVHDVHYPANGETIVWQTIQIIFTWLHISKTLLAAINFGSTIIASMYKWHLLRHA